ncbi:MAG: PQQ-binding-like beta-propeller repeat protein [Gemmataceae bacterium]
MSRRLLLIGLATGCGLVARAGDWPQWRGPNRDAHVSGFTAPATWPKELVKKWSVPVGDGVGTPALVGDKLFVFTRQGGDEVTRCMAAATGQEVWQDKYPAAPATGPAGSFPGPRASPVVAQGKVITYGVQGALSCLDAATGKALWRKAEPMLSPPMFFTSSSPIVVGGLCVVQLGGDRGGAVAALDLATGEERWRWAGDGTKYASPALLTVDGTTMVVAVTANNLVGIAADSGKLLWQVSLAGAGAPKGGGGKGAKGGKGGGRAYNAGSPVIDGQTVITSGAGRGVTAYRVGKTGDKWAATEVWANKELAAEFDTPVVHDGRVFGLSDRNALFCLDSKTGKAAWTADIRGGNRPGYGSIVDAGSVLLALTPAGRLTVFEPTDKEFKQVAEYPVGTETYAYPVVDGRRVYVKDKSALTLWLIE